MVIRKRLKISGLGLSFVTTTVTDWVPVFHNKKAADLVVTQLRETMNYFQVSLAGYVLMPSHLHALLGFRQVNQLSKLMQSFKSLSSRGLKEMDLGKLGSLLHVDGKFRLWKPRFDDLLIISEDQFRTKLDYIHNNPVKAGLVAKPEEWLYSSAVDWLVDSEGLLEIDKTFSWNR